MHLGPAPRRAVPCPAWTGHLVMACININVTVRAARRTAGVWRGAVWRGAARGGGGGQWTECSAGTPRPRPRIERHKQLGTEREHERCGNTVIQCHH